MCVCVCVCLQVNQTKDKVLKKKELYAATEAEALILGRKLHGSGFAVGSASPRHLGLKRKVEMGETGVRVS